MFENRAIISRPKPLLILDKRFSIFDSLAVGENGQVIIDGVIEGEELVMQDDGNELITKTIRLLKIDKVGNKNIIRIDIK